MKCVHRNLEKHLDRNKGECGKCFSVSTWKSLDRILPLASASDVADSSSTWNKSATNFFTGNNEKRTTVKTPRFDKSVFNCSLEKIILSLVQRRVIQCFSAFNVSEHQQLSSFHIMFKTNAPRYFIDRVRSKVKTVKRKFEKNGKALDHRGRRQ